jgi:hypothetical protein
MDQIRNQTALLEHGVANMQAVAINLAKAHEPE